MRKARAVTVTVFTGSAPALFGAAGGAAQAVRWLAEQIMSIPREHLGSARVDLHGEEHGPVEITISYERPETQEDRDAQKRHLRVSLDAIEAKEREDLRRLLTKYPDEASR